MFLSYTPAPPLAPFVENFWLYRGYVSPHLKERIVQDGTFKVVFNLEQDQFRIYDPWCPTNFAAYSGAIASRPSGAPFVTDSAEEAHVLGVNFKVGGAFAFLGSAAAEAGGSHIDLANVWGCAANELHHRMAHQSDPSERFRTLERALLQRLASGERHHPAAYVALQLLGGSCAVSRTREVAQHVGLSQRRLITIFEREVGIAPKLFSRVRRFQRALTLMRGDVVPQWSTLALECGYCDQSHMIRDFVAFSGFTPSGYLQRQRTFAEQGVRVKHNHMPLSE